MAIAKWRVGSRNLVSDKEQPQVLLKVLFDERRDFALRADSANLFDLLAVLDEERALAGMFQIMSIPSLLLFKDGKKVEEIRGVRPKGEITSLIEKHL